MKNYLKSMLLILLGLLLGVSAPYLLKNFNKAANSTGYRDLEMKVDVAGHDIMIWKTVIPAQQQDIPGIAMHRHEYARILIPLTQGVLQRRDRDGSITDYVLNIGKPVFLPEDTALGFHTDENLGNMPIEVMIVQFTQSPVTTEELTELDLQKVIKK